jgi:hypothetical protein
MLFPSAFFWARVRTAALALALAALAGDRLAAAPPGAGLGAAPAADGPKLIGAFGPSTGEFDPAGARRLKGKTPLWDSLQGNNTNAGVFQWGPFILQPGFALEVAGSIGDPGVSLYWQDAASGQRLLLAPRNPPGPRWTLYHWSPPAAWVGRTVYLGAEDHSLTAWMGLGTPQEASAWPGRWLPLAGLQISLFALLLLPGWAWAAWCLRSRDFSAEQFLILALVTSATAAYALFWITFLQRTVGLAAAWAVLLASLAAVCRSRGAALRRIAGELAGPLALTLAAGLMYLAVLLLYGGQESPAIVSLDRYIHNLPPDPLLPYWLSQRLFTGAPLRPFFADWLSSDRPPLQAAFHLLVSPLAASESGYQVMATILQTWVLLGLWVLLRLAQIPRRAIAWTLSFVIFSGFFLLNGTFVWPKLLPAAFLLIAAALLWYRPGRAPVLVGACAGLAMAAHGGSAFALLGLGLWFLGSRRAGGGRFCLLAAGVAAAYLLPWSLYQKYYDPPGNRLLKWHLAGAMAPDARTLGRTLADAYGGLPFSHWLAAKESNVGALFTDEGSRLGYNLRTAADLARHGRPSAAFRQAAYSFRLGGMLHMFQSPGVLDCGALGLLWAWARRRAGDPALDLARRCLLLTGICLGVWCLLMFSPGATLNHQGTYFTNGCLFVALAMGVLTFPRWLVWLLAAANLAFFLLVWVFFADRGDFTTALLSSADPALACLFVLALAATLGCLIRLGADGETGLA